MSKERDLNTLKGQFHEIFTSGFFSSNFLSKILEGTNSKFTASVVDTGIKLFANRYCRRDQCVSQEKCY